ncbi:hypothetical protein EZ444_24660 [Pedobacter hiemivivus]|uniref:histidine kinase n=1 Tax=Pedobacter hiemivivus TaxID=2530454 RepID=A0A4R0MH37_9SPHI|nr:hypothetical protein EZ444_24660 [Pedobacter hiemivivus]
MSALSHKILVLVIFHFKGITTRTGRQYPILGTSLYLFYIRYLQCNIKLDKVIIKISKWLCLILPLLLALGASAQLRSDTLNIKDNATFQFNEHLYYYQTPDKLSVKEVSKLININSFKKLYPDHAINAGVTNSYYWLSFTLKNEQKADDTFYFQLHQPWLHLAQLYLQTDTGYVLVGQSGMKLNFNARPYTHYDIVFPIKLRSQSHGTFLALIDNKGSSLNILPTLMDSDSFRAEEKKEYLFLGVLTGIMIFSILINIFLYLSLKEKIHLIYAQYVLAMLYWMYCNVALDFQYLYPNQPFLATISEYIAASLGFITMTNLITAFLDVTVENSRFKRSMDVLKYFFFIFPVAGFMIHYWFDNSAALKVAYEYALISVAFILSILFYLVAIEKIFQKVKLAWFYLIGGGFIGFGILKYCIYLLGGSLNSGAQSLPNDIQIGLVIEAIIIFIGIVYRYNLYKNDKEQILLKFNLQQKETLQQIVTAQEDERKRIAQDLHDDLGSTLITLLLHISNLPDSQDQKNKESQAHYQKSIDIGHKAISDLRSISHNLLPKDFTELGIFHILRNKIDELKVISNIRFTLITEGNDQDIGNIFSITIYRIINELINNTLKHSQASLATIQLLLTNDEIIVMLEDNGIGGSTTAFTEGIGMKNVRSRTDFLHGKINIDDSTEGTSIIIEIPLENTAKATAHED